MQYKPRRAFFMWKTEKDSMQNNHAFNAKYETSRGSENGLTKPKNEH